MKDSPIYAPMPVSETWERTTELRQVIDGHQGFIGLQQAWRCRENGKIKWQFLPTVAAHDAL